MLHNLKFLVLFMCIPKCSLSICIPENATLFQPTYTACELGKLSQNRAVEIGVPNYLRKKAIPIESDSNTAYLRGD